MARNVLVDAGFVVALLSSRDAHHNWAVTQASEMPQTWATCEAVLSEAFHLLGERGAPNLGALLRRRPLLVGFALVENVGPVMKLIERYSNVPMGFADACLGRGFLQTKFQLVRGAAVPAHVRRWRYHFLIDLRRQKV
jgi:predicted nucleic acid-binding protein